MSAKQKNILILILGLALGVRVALAIHHPFLFDDSKDYDTIAKNLLIAHSYQVNGLFATRMPGYPLLVTAIYAVTNYSQFAVLIVQAVLGMLTVMIVHRLAGRVSQTVGLLAAFLAAVDPLSVGFSAALLSEIPFTFALMLSLWLAVTIAETPRPAYRLWVWLGAAWLVGVYLRPSALLCIVPIVAVLMLGAEAKMRLRVLMGILICGAIVVVGLLPWQIRNYGLFHSRFFRLTTLEGISLYEAVYPAADGSPKQDKIPLPDAMFGMNEAERNDEWTRRAWSDIAADPGRIVKLAAVKIGRTWSPSLNASEYQNPDLQLLMKLWYIPLYVLAVVGMIRRGLRVKIKLLLLAPVVYFTCVHALFLGSVRYRVPLMPVVCVFAAAAFAWGKDQPQDESAV